MKKIMKRRTMPLLLTIILLVVAGAGAAAGTVLSGKVDAVSNIAVSQALLTEAPEWQTEGDICKLLYQGTNADFMTQQVFVHRLFIHEANRYFGAVADDNTGFQAAAEIAVGDWVSFNLPLKNASENDLGATLTLDIPEGLEVEVWRSSLASNINSVVRLNDSTWRIEVVAGAEYDHVTDCLMFTVDADDIAAPGYYTISGTLSQVTLGRFITQAFSTRGKILFDSDRSSNNEIWVMNDDGSNQTNLTNNAADECFSSWSPLGDKIAFTSDRDGNPEIYVMNADGSNQVRLTNNPATDKYPAWSPDGSKIAFASDRDGNYEVYVMNPDGTNQVNLTNDPGYDTYPTWCPTSTKILFSTTRDGNYEVYVMNTDGSNQTNLTNNAAEDCYTAWSPDCTKILFKTDRDGNSEIYKMDPDGSNQVNVSTAPGSDEWSPVWSPDGTKIAFSTNRDGDYEVYVMYADGTGQTNLSCNAAADDMPAW